MHGLFLESSAVTLHRSKSTFKNSLQFFLFFIASAVRKLSVFSTGISGNVCVIHRCTRILYTFHILIPAFAVQSLHIHTTLQMHISFYLIPWNHKTSSMRAKYRSGRIFQIRFRIISNILYHFILILTWCISFKAAKKFSCSMCVGNNFFLIIPHLSDSRSSFKDCSFALYLRCIKRSLHLLDICHCTSDHFSRNFQAKFIIRFQKNIFCFAKSLTDSTISCLSEISTFRMFRMCPSGKNRNLHISQWRSSQYTNMLLFFKMRQNQSLPVSCKYILTACSKELASASWFPRFDQKMYFCIMTERFKMSHTFYRLCNRFFINNTSGTKFHSHMKTIPDHFFQNLNLYFSHKLCMNLRKLAVPQNVKLRFLLLQLTQLLEHLMWITVIRKDNLVIQDRFQYRKF